MLSRHYLSGNAFKGGEANYKVLVRDDSDKNWYSDKAVAKCGDYTYDTLVAALAAAQDGETVTLLKDVTEDNLTIAKSITLEGNGKKITANTNGLTVNANNVTLDNVSVTSAEGQALDVVSGATGTVVKGGEFVSTSPEKQGEGAVRFEGNNGKISVTDAKFTGGLHVLNYASGDLTIKGNTFDVDESLKSNGNVVCGILIKGTGAKEKQAKNGDAYLSGNAFKGGEANYKVLIQDENGKTYFSDKMAVKIGDVCYATLSDAIAAAQANDTVTLQNDMTLQAKLEIGAADKAQKDFTLDLGGHTLTGRLNFTNAKVTIQNGQIDAGTFDQAVNAYGSATEANDYTVLTIAKDVTLTGTYGLCVFGETYTSNTSYGVKIDFAGEAEARYPLFVSGNIGSNNVTAMHDKDKAPEVNITGTLKAMDTIAGDDSPQGISLNGYAVVNVQNGADISGNEAIGVKAGILNVTGGTLTATGPKVDPVQAVSSGTEASGGAIAVSSFYNANSGTIKVNVSGGTITSENNAALLVTHSYANSVAMPFTKGVEVNVTGGTFKGGADKTVWVADKVGDDSDKYPTKFISGGEFNTDMTSTGYVKDGYYCYRPLVIVGNYKVEECKNHDWSEWQDNQDGATHSKTCSKCHLTETGNHDENGSDKACSVCGYQKYQAKIGEVYYATLNDAIAVATSGTDKVVTLTAGSKVNIAPNSTLTLNAAGITLKGARGENGEYLSKIIRDQIPSGNNMFIYVNTDHITFEDLYIEYATDDSAWNQRNRPILTSEAADHFTMKNCYLKGPNGANMLLNPGNGADDGIIEGNTFEGGSSGIYIRPCERTVIKNNTFINNGKCITFEPTAETCFLNVEVSGNTFNLTRSGGTISGGHRFNTGDYASTIGIKIFIHDQNSWGSTNVIKNNTFVKVNGEQQQAILAIIPRSGGVGNDYTDTLITNVKNTFSNDNSVPAGSVLCYKDPSSSDATTLFSPFN